MDGGGETLRRRRAGRSMSPAKAAREERSQLILNKLLQVAHSIRCGRGGKHWLGREPGRSQLLAMKHIIANAGGSVSELARALGVSLSNASNLVDKLERKGWVGRRRSADDQRAVLLDATADGITIARAFRSPSPSRMESALASLPETAARQLEAGLDALIEKATEKL